MDIRFTTILYSKFSEPSQRLLELIESLTLDTKNTLNIAYVCIDTQKMKNLVLQSDLNIKSVPCILVSRISGHVDKYEGEIAFIWINKFIPPVVEQQNNTMTTLLQQPDNNDVISELERKILQLEEKLNERLEETQHQPEIVTVDKNKYTPINDIASLPELVDDDELIQDTEFSTEPKSAMKVKQENLHNLAAEMQKERDMADENMKQKQRRIF